MLSFKFTLIRTAITLMAVFGVGALGYFYYGSALYSGPKVEEAPWSSLLYFMQASVLLVAFKLFLYDIIGRKLVLRNNTTPTKRIFIGGYGIALLIDLIMVFMSFKPIYMNLALFGTITYSPLVLFASLVALLIVAALARKNRA